MRFGSIILVACAFLVCHANEEQKMAPASIIEVSLSKLTTRGKEAHPWVVFTDSSLGRFVQFGYENEVLFIDVPLVAMTDEEEKKLAEVFRSVGVKRPVTRQARDPKTLKSFTSQSYQADFAQDVKQATTFAIRVFHEVFGIETPDLTVEEGSG